MGEASLVVAKRAPLVDAVRCVFPSPCRLDEAERKGFSTREVLE